MKKIITAITTILLVLSFSACTQNSQMKTNQYQRNETVGRIPNPNTVTGRKTDVHNLGSATNTMSKTASQVPGVQKATVFTNGGTAYVRIMVDKNVTSGDQINKVRQAVSSAVKKKMPRFNVKVYVGKIKATNK